ncbi:hypothetical protein V2A60_001155 [Cordyceps javanica]|uniref:Eukaryotic translation initiation factor 3 subunit J n=1 Tax=Cordyceps javanica TaxID=43265 RepID=A0A545V2Q4_9HYPO|nr:translation initiation factor eIF3 subunit [Cordyceps javanica]TQW06803.1 translation initiation factor eIF3 subunit [Cordyceps javanica]
MPPAKQWDDEDSESDTPSTSPVATAPRRRQFDDEEDDDDVLDSWDAAEDSEVEREKARKATEAKEKKAVEDAANKKTKLQRIADHQKERARMRAEEDSSDEEEEDEAERRARLRRTEQEADLRHAEDLFDGIGISNNRSKTIPGSNVVVDSKDPGSTVDLAKLPIFNPQTKKQFEQLRQVLVPVITANAKKGHYCHFLEEFAKELSKELGSEQIKKIASSLTRAGNEKQKEEKAADKTGKKSKAAKTKTSLVTTRANTNDMETYDNDAFGDDDFM